MLSNYFLMNKKNKNQFQLRLLLFAGLMGLFFSSHAIFADFNVYVGETKYPITQNTFLLDSDGTGGNVGIEFGSSGEQVLWDSGNARFNFTDDLLVDDGFRVGVDYLVVNGVTGVVDISQNLQVAGSICDDLGANCSTPAQINTAASYAAVDETDTNATKDKVLSNLLAKGWEDHKNVVTGNPHVVTQTEVGLGSLTNDTQLKIASNLSDLANAVTARTNLGVAIGTDVQAYDAQLADIAGLGVTDSNFIVGDGANWVAESGATARTSLGLGNVEDTALSTWAGTASITTVGTLASGSIGGAFTAIGDAYISSSANWNTAFGWGDHSVQNYLDLEIGRASGRERV